jgi:hypothetical protein
MLLASLSCAYPSINNHENTLVERKHKGSDQEPGNLPCVANADGYGVGQDGLLPRRRNLISQESPAMHNNEDQAKERD